MGSGAVVFHIPFSSPLRVQLLCCRTIFKMRVASDSPSEAVAMSLMRYPAVYVRSIEAPTIIPRKLEAFLNLSRCLINGNHSAPIDSNTYIKTTCPQRPPLPKLLASPSLAAVSVASAPLLLYSNILISTFKFTRQRQPSERLVLESASDPMPSKL